MITLLRTLVLFVLLTGLVHIFSIVATPFFAKQKVWQRVVEFTQPRKLAAIKNHEKAAAILGQADPAMAYAVCHFLLEDGPVTLTAEGPTSFWSVTLFNKDAEIIYSLNDDASQTSQLNLSILHKSINAETTDNIPEDNTSPVQKEELIPTPIVPPNPDEPEEPEEQELVEVDLNEEDGNIIQARVSENEVFAVLKIFKATRHHRKLIEETIEAAQCK
ncbi:MAG: hypothetical protein ABJN78_03990 [Hyphomicrobiales bacterium]